MNLQTQTFDPPSSEMLLQEWLRYWLESYIRPVAKPSGYEHYRDNVEKHILPRLGSIPMSELSPRVIQHFLNEEARSGNLRDRGPLSPKSMRNMRVVLDVALKQALSEGVISSNPVPLTVVRSVRTRRVQILTDETQAKLEEYLFTHPHNYHAGILLAMFTGMRLGEVCALQWKDYNAATGRLRIGSTVRRQTNYDASDGENRTVLITNETKTDTSDRILTMPPVLRELLENQCIRFADRFHAPTDEDYIVFCGKGTMLDPDNLTHYFTRLLKKLGLPHVKFHALRHTFATRAIENGIDVATVSGLLGHADVTTTTHYYVQPREAAMDQAMRSITPVGNSGSSSNWSHKTTIPQNTIRQGGNTNEQHAR